jgi:hypothetical protein
MDRRVGGPQRRPGRWSERKILPLPGTETPPSSLYNDWAITVVRMKINKKGFGRKRSWSVQVLSQQLPGETEETRTNLIQDSKCPGRDPNRVPSEYKSKALSLDSPVLQHSYYLLVWYGCETWSLLLLEDGGCICFEKEVWRGISGSHGTVSVLVAESVWMMPKSTGIVPAGTLTPVVHL